MKKLFNEILSLLVGQSGYAIIGSVAYHIYTGGYYSNDFDLQTVSLKKLREFEQLFKGCGFKKVKDEVFFGQKGSCIITLKKERQDFAIDIVFNPSFFKKYKAKQVLFAGRKIRVITPESLLILKLSAALRSDSRSTDKKRRDFKAALELFKVANKKELSNIFEKRLKQNNIF